MASDYALKSALGTRPEKGGCIACELFAELKRARLIRPQ
jgi:hypothetical protein